MKKNIISRTDIARRLRSVAIEVSMDDWAAANKMALGAIKLARGLEDNIEKDILLEELGYLNSKLMLRMDADRAATHARSIAADVESSI